MTALWSRDFAESAGREESEGVNEITVDEAIEQLRVVAEMAETLGGGGSATAIKLKLVLAELDHLREENERLRAELAQREKPCECGQGLRLFDAREQRWEILMADRSENFDQVDMYQPVGAPCPYCGHRLEAPTDGV